MLTPVMLGKSANSFVLSRNQASSHLYFMSRTVPRATGNDAGPSVFNREYPLWGVPMSLEIVWLMEE